jgi:hypothetical protein
METTNTRSLVKKLTTIMAELGPLPRTGEKRGQTRAGGEFSYDVFLESDILQPVQRALSAHGVVIVPETVALDRREFPSDRPDRAPQKLVDVMVRFTVCDADSGEQLVGQMPGSAEERGDGTRVSKALTDANKNFLRKLFEVAADGQGKVPRPQPRQTPAAPKQQQTPSKTGENEIQRLSDCQVTEVNETTKNGRKYLWVRVIHVGQVINAIADDPKTFPSVRVGKGEVHLSQHDGWKYPRITYAALDVAVGSSRAAVHDQGRDNAETRR